MCPRFEDLKGKTLMAVVGKIGDEEIRFIGRDGTEYILYYEHD